jgi:hypothetical protein
VRVAPAEVAADVDNRRWPGLFRVATGTIAANAPAIDFATDAAASDGAAGLSRLKLGGGAGRELAGWVALAALACIAGAAGTWERRRRRGTEAARRPGHLEVETELHVETIFEADGHVHRHETEVGP